MRSRLRRHPRPVRHPGVTSGMNSRSKHTVTRRPSPRCRVAGAAGAAVMGGCAVTRLAGPPSRCRPTAGPVSGGRRSNRAVAGPSLLTLSRATRSPSRSEPFPQGQTQLRQCRRSLGGGARERSAVHCVKACKDRLDERRRTLAARIPDGSAATCRLKRVRGSVSRCLIRDAWDGSRPTWRPSLASRSTWCQPAISSSPPRPRRK